jgi:hypothetical protein
VGILEAKIEEIYSTISKIKKEIHLQRFFELGADDNVLKRFEIYFEKISSTLKELEPVYESKPFAEAKAYFESIRVARTTQAFLKEIRRKEEGNTENTRKFLEYLNSLEAILDDFSKSKIGGDKTKEHNDNQNIMASSGVSSVRSTIPETNITRTTDQDQSTLNTSKTKSFLLKILVIVFVSIFVTFPRVLGRAILEVFGRDKASDTTQLLVGYTLLIGIGLVWVLGGTAISLFKDVWRFFFPVK